MLNNSRLYPFLNHHAVMSTLQTKLTSILSQPPAPHHLHPVSQIAVEYLKQHNVYDDHWYCTFTNGCLVWFRVQDITINDHTFDVNVCIEVRKKIVTGCSVYITLNGRNSESAKVDTEHLFDYNLAHTIKQSLDDVLRVHPHY